ncbi:hypothetical protein F7734_33855 [Scytonema sp. UIC 10036]|uniref:hypothetical protein n=1 Tax=Scytonema sp. UIC 10036 TaxID=2304196 RepID=UPI0012DA499D|nr:hypothetical protein [Scytonema sp. UIC 10036]MUG97057.1 hypothetical protein [Scytonema sp. UIC 10036]
MRSKQGRQGRQGGQGRQGRGVCKSFRTAISFFKRTERSYNFIYYDGRKSLPLDIELYQQAEADSLLFGEKNCFRSPCSSA